MKKKLFGLMIAAILITSFNVIVFAGGSGGELEPLIGIIPIECPEDCQGQDED